jgi:uncharacterized Fe-S cluster-containing MiaB family protein
VAKLTKENCINYFGDKISKRMKDFAVHKNTEDLATRGQSCLDGFKKNSNKEWAQKFFVLNLGRIL